MKLLNANLTPTIVGIEPLPGHSNYFLGNDPNRWHTDVKHYNRVKYQTVYPGIDLVYYGNQRQLEYDFVVAPSANPRAIQLEFEGAEKIDISQDGDLVLQTAMGEIRQHRPTIYQEVEGKRVEVTGKYVLQTEKIIGFELGEYDSSVSLVIDPILSYATYWGGNGFDEVRSIALDPLGNIYITGPTGSTDFPLLDPFQATNSGGEDAYITKLNPDATAILYSTLVGGNGFDHARSIAVDNNGNAHITGGTGSSNFPTTSAFQSLFGGIADVFVVKLNASGNGLIYSTYIGGAAYDDGLSIALDTTGQAYLTGFTDSMNFPTMNPILPSLRGTRDPYLLKLNAAGSGLVYSTYLGGNGADEWGHCIAVDSIGNAYVSGWTDSFNFPTVNPIQSTLGGGADAFVAKMNQTGTALVYSTYLGGNRPDISYGLAIDTLGSAYVIGITDSPNFPLANPLQPVLRGQSDAFVAKLNPAGTSLIYSTYLGGDGVEYGWDIAVDTVGNVYAVGQTGSSNFPTVNPIQLTYQGAVDAFVTKISPTGSALLYSTYLGGNGEDHAWSIAVDTIGNAYPAGHTSSTNFPTVNALYPLYRGSPRDAFFAKIIESGLPQADLVITQSVTPNPVPAGGAVTILLRIQNNGPDLASNVLLVELPRSCQELWK
jgi:hypothetical protein